MNVHYDQSYESLIQLLRSAHSFLPSHFIALDHDGEIIIDADIRYPNVPMKTYKYYTELRKEDLHDWDRLQRLFNTILTVSCGEAPMLGSYNIRAAA